MLDRFVESYYWLDLLVGYGAPLALFLAVRLGFAPRKYARLFLLGAALGLFWEIPVFVLSRHTDVPIIQWLREPPLHYAVFMVGHTLWDGALFAGGAALAALVTRRPALSAFSWAELAVLVAWGQATAFLVEYSSILSRAWVYVEGYPWNPTLAAVHGHPVTLAMQATWLLATVAFYLIGLRMERTRN